MNSSISINTLHMENKYVRDLFTYKMQKMGNSSENKIWQNIVSTY